jgi:hypothetical protein
MLQKTMPHFGGCRWWFLCPLSPNGFLCRRRVHKLFLPPGATYFGCRECYELTNKSRREDAKNRALRKARKIRVRLGGSVSFLDEFPAKPKGMWERTYRRLKGQAEDAENRATPLIQNWLEQLPEDPER